jgi:hypothetical protein
MHMTQIMLNFVSLIHRVMRKKILFFTLLLQVFVSTISEAQIVYAENNAIGCSLNSDEMPTNNSGVSKKEVVHFSFDNYNRLLSNEIERIDEALLAHRFQSIQETYTYTTPVAPGNPGLKTVIRKPVIYNSVVKLEKYYKKQFKNGLLSADETNKALLKVFDVALVAFYSNTEEFEKQLKTTKQISTITLIFENTEIVHK